METTPAADPRLGMVVAGRYRLNARIGRGGMGAIYEAQHATTGKRFALKMLLPGLGGVDEIVKRFEREAHAASVLSHPNVVSVVDFGSHDGSLFLVMELVSGRSLGEVMDYERVPTLRALAITRQVAEALGHAHAHGVVHRDLKPDNVMLVDAGASDEERDIVKLLDFGIAKIVGDAQAEAGEKLTQAGVAFGTPDYMAPEQALGEEVDARADLYALGCILHELLTGKPPFDNVDKLAVLRMHVAVSAPPLDDGFTPELRALVAKSLEKRRDDRFADATAMLAAIDAAIAAEAGGPADLATLPELSGPHDKTHPPPQPPGEGFRFSPRALLALAGGAVLIATVLGIALQPRGRPSPARPVERVVAVEAAGWRAAGFAFAAAGRDDEAVAAHRRALTAAPSADPLILRWVADVLAKKHTGAVELLPLLGKEGRAMLVEQASRGRTAAVRARARELAAEAGLTAEVDLVGSFTLDLQQGSSCRERREAVPRLRALGDKRAIPILKRARSRSGGFLGLSQVNSCLEREAGEAIEFLQALP